MSSTDRTEPKETISINLGDVIQIEAPTNRELNRNTYLVDYIDARKIKLINVDNLSDVVLKIDTSTGKLKDESINTIAILRRADVLGYARQNGLVVGKWIDIHFGGDLPTTITGLITNLEEDMIEIKTYPDDDMIYIDFEYKGLPENIPIERINIRQAPQKETQGQEQEQEQQEQIEEQQRILETQRGLLSSREERQQRRVQRQEQEKEQPSNEGEGEMLVYQPRGITDATPGVIGAPPSEEDRVANIIAPPKAEIQEKLRELLFDADQIVFGEELDVLVQTVDVPEEQKRYSIERQTNDLLDELLSNVPNSQRTNRVIANLHKMVERFKQLRTEFSKFDENGNATIPDIKGALHKPLVNTLYNFNKNLQWILPVVKNKRKIQLKQVWNSELNNDVSAKSIDDFKDDIENLTDTYKGKGKGNVLSEYMAKMSGVITPFKEPDNMSGVITSRRVNDNITAIIDNLDDFYSTVVSASPVNSENAMDMINTRKYVIQKYNLGLSKLRTTKHTGSKMSAEFTQTTPNDTMYVKSVIVFPEQIMNYSRISLPGTNILDKSNLNMVPLSFWKTLKQDTSIITHEIEDLTKPLDFNSKHFLESIKQFTISPDVRFAAATTTSGNDDESPSPAVDKYRQFLDLIIPKTRVFFEIMQRYIHGRLSFTEVVSFLEPFMVYHNDLTAKQYDEITEFIYQRVLEYKRNYANLSRKFNKIRTFKYSLQYAGITMLYKLLVSGKMLDSNVFASYGFTDAQVRSQPGTTNAITEQEKLREKGRAFSSGLGAQKEYNENLLTSSELISRIVALDCAKVYMDSIALTTSDLITPFDFNLIMKEQLNQTTSTVMDTQSHKPSNSNSESGNIRGFTLAKVYPNVDAVEEANQNAREMPIYYDKQYDTTDYNSLSLYKTEKANMSEADFHMFLVNEFIKHKNMRLEDAETEADAVLEGVRKVMVGDYAVVEEEEESDEPRFLYYKMTKTPEGLQWKRDVSIPETVQMDDPSYFCNSMTGNGCILSLSGSEQEPQQGETLEPQEYKGGASKEEIEQNILNEMTKEFDMKYQITKDKFLDFLNKKFDYDLHNLTRLTKLSNLNFYKYNDRKYQIGIEGDKNNEMDYEVVVSPNASLRDMILGQGDYVKKQHDIMKFVNAYTRRANPVLEEDPHWLYCIKTNEKLLPTFFETIATAFIQHSASGTISQLTAVIDTICKERGTLSDDGEAQVDKYSGYTIKRIEHSTDEGFDEAGFKITRDTLETDVRDEYLKQAITPQLQSGIDKFTNPNARMINNIITTMSGYIGVNLNDQREFIIQQTVSTLENSLPSEDIYKARSEQLFKEKGKHLPPYKEAYFKNLLLLTLAYLVVAIQTAIPSLKTRKTHAGCVRSFSGFPLDGAEDITGITYVACIAFKIRSSIEPWNTLKNFKKETDLIANIKLYVEKYILTVGAIQEKLQTKRDYLKQQAGSHDDVPQELDVKRWQTFMPSLNDMADMKTPQNVSTDFNNSLLDAMKKGHRSQHEKLLLLEAKALYFSLYTQQLINEVVKSKSPLIMNNSGEPFMENACCNEGEGDTRNIRTIDYFIKENQLIQHNNTVIKYLTDVLLDMDGISKASFLSDYQHTKMKYPAIPQIFDEATIYAAFISYCQLNTGMPISDELKLMCMERPSDWNSADSIQEKIQKLKRDSRIFTGESLDKLLQIVNNDSNHKLDSRIVRNDGRHEYSQIQQLRDVLTHLDSKYTDCQEKCVVSDELRRLLTENMDRFEIATDEDTEEMRNLKNYLALENDTLITRIMAFLQENVKQSKAVKSAGETMKTLLDFEPLNTNILISPEDETAARCAQFMKNTMFRVTDVLPQIIVNGVDFDMNELSMPKHWGFSERHNRNLQNIISQHYTGIRQFYNDTVVKDVIEAIGDKAADLEKMSAVTPFFAEINGEYAVFDRKIVLLLHKHYFLLLLNAYIELVQATPTSIFQAEPMELATKGTGKGTGKGTTKGTTKGTNKGTITGRSMVGKGGITARQQEQEQEQDLLFSTSEVISSQTGVMNEIDMIIGNKRALGKKVAELIIAYLNIVEKDKAAINMNNNSIKEKYMRVKDKEKDQFVSYITEMSDEERVIENIKKKYKMGRWGLGLERSIFEYDPEEYDRAMKERERIAMMERRLGNKDVVTAMNREVLLMDALDEADRAAAIEREEYSMANVPDDDDYPDDESYITRYDD